MSPVMLSLLPRLTTITLSCNGLAVVPAAALYKDFHQLAVYGSIPSQPNVSLIAGSGIGDGEGVWPYIAGEWALELQCAACAVGVLFWPWAMIT